MYPHERSLVKKLEGKPFALLGVNRDISRESLKKSEEKHQITWRSFFDGRDGPISKRHNIQSMPTVFVLDATGVIRYKGVRDEAMDRAVDQLLAELEQAPGVIRPATRPVLLGVDALARDESCLHPHRHGSSRAALVHRRHGRA